MVDNPNQVTIIELTGDESIMIEVRVANADYDRLLGKHGRTIDAIRLLMRAAGHKAELGVVRLDLIED